MKNPLAACLHQGVFLRALKIILFFFCAVQPEISARQPFAGPGADPVVAGDAHICMDRPVAKAFCIGRVIGNRFNFIA